MLGCTLAMSAPGVAAADDAGIRARAGSYLPVAGPRLAGASVYWARYRSDGGYELLGRRGTEPAKLRLSVPEADPGRYWGVTFAASSQLLAVQQRRAHVSDPNPYQTPEGPEDPGTLIGPPGGTLQHASKPCPGAFFDDRRVDVSGTAAIYPTSCDYSGASATIKDFAPGGKQRSIPSVGSGPLRLAGSYAAWRSTTGSIIVYDWVRAAIVYSLSVPIDWDPTFDLQEDAKLALTYQPRILDADLRTRVAWASPAEPRLHLLPLKRRSRYRVQISHDRIAYVGSTHNGEWSSHSVLGVVDLAGHARRVATGVQSLPPFEDSLSLEGDQLAWVQATCDGPVIRSADITRLRALRGARSCPLHLSRRGRTASSRRLVFGASCRGFYRGCEPVAGSLRTVRRYRVGHRVLPRGSRITRSATKHKANRLRLRLLPRGRRLLHARRSILARLAIQVSDNQGYFDSRTEVVRVRIHR